jgi:hypothetical protein
MVEFLTETLYKKVWILGYKSSLSPSLHEKASPDCVLHLDDIWEAISVPCFKNEVLDMKKPIEKLIWSPEIENNS